MYLETSDKAKVSGEGEPMADTLLAEQCQVPKLTGAADPKDGAELEYFVDYTEQTVHREIHSSLTYEMSGEEPESFSYCNGHAEGLVPYASSDGFCESDETLDACDECPGLSQTSDECAPHKSPERSDNQSLAPNKCCEHLGLFKQCGRHSECVDCEPDGVERKCGSFASGEMSDLTTESSENPEMCEDLDSEPDSYTEESDPLEYEDLPTQTEFTNSDDEETGSRLSEDVDSTPVDASPEDCEMFEDAEEQTQQTTDQCEMFGNDDSETSEEFETQRCVESSEVCGEEDGFSDCSSVETKSFKTCPDDSLPSEPCSYSSGGSEKEAREYSSDEQTQWESFEDDEEMEQSHGAHESDEDRTKTDVSVVVEDYFDLFDRSDYGGHTFAPQRRYISCFDGGDVHEGLYLQVEEAKQVVENVDVYKDACEKTCEEEADVCEEAADTSPEDDGESETRGPEDLIADLESSLAEEEEEEENASYSEEDDISNEEARSSEDIMSAPCAEDISVEGDAYEEDAQIYASSPESSSTIDSAQTVIEGKVDEAITFIDCLEKEPCWTLIEIECDDGEMFNPDVEDYFAFQIRSVQSSFNQNGRLLETVRHGEGVNERNEGADISASSSVESKVVRLEMSEVIDLSENLEESANEGAAESEEVKSPLDIIHSVVPEHAKNTEEENGSERSRDSDEEPSDDDDDESSETCDCEYCIPPKEQVPVKPLLPTITSSDTGKICVILDLDETLVHSSFKPLNNPDFIIPVEIDETVHQVYVLKRPHVDEFLRRMGELFECVLFTASLAKYADPVSDLLDHCGAFRSRLFRESCVFHKGNYVKDLSRLGRDLNKVVILDNSPASYDFHPDHAVPVTSWFDDTSDTELLDLLPVFERLSNADDVCDVIKRQKFSS